MIDIERLKKKKDETYKKRFEQWYEKNEIENAIIKSVLDGYRGFKIEIREENNIEIKLMKEDEKFVQLLKEKLPGFSITRHSGTHKTLFDMDIYYSYIIISW